MAESLDLVKYWGTGTTMAYKAALVQEMPRLLKYTTFIRRAFNAAVSAAAVGSPWDLSDMDTLPVLRGRETSIATSVSEPQYAAYKELHRRFYPHMTRAEFFHAVLEYALLHNEYYHAPASKRRKEGHVAMLPPRVAPSSDSEAAASPATSSLNGSVFPARRRDWADALRSGRFQRGETGLLRENDHFSALGVGCSVSRLGEWRWHAVGAVYNYAAGNYGSNAQEMPEAVTDYYGLASGDCLISICGGVLHVYQGTGIRRL